MRISKEQIKHIEEQYPRGTRIRLIHMADDLLPVPQDGTTGTVEMVDSIGQIHMQWDNGSGIAIIPWLDVFVHENSIN